MNMNKNQIIFAFALSIAVFVLSLTAASAEAKKKPIIGSEPEATTALLSTKIDKELKAKLAVALKADVDPEAAKDMYVRALRARAVAEYDLARLQLILSKAEPGTKEHDALVEVLFASAQSLAIMDAETRKREERIRAIGETREKAFSDLLQARKALMPLESPPAK